ncbi:unnamed protein product [Lampetra planeri]
MAVRSWWSDLSVMPLDVRGRTRATLNGSACVRPSPAGVGNPLKPIRDRDWGLELFPMNEEFPVSASHKLALIKSLPFVHTARRYYRLDGLVRSSDWPRWGRRLPWGCAEKTIELDCLEEVKVVTRWVVRYWGVAASLVRFVPRRGETAHRCTAAGCAAPAALHSVQQDNEAVRPEDSAVALKGRPLVPYERIHRGHAPRRSRRACAPSGPRCSVEPAGARRTSSALVTGADCSQCVTDHGSALGCGCATDCGRPGSAVKAGFVAGRGGIRPHLGAGGAPPARLARCVGEVERERQGALEWVRPEIGACALQSAAAPAASGLALRAGSVGLGREAGSGRALRLGEAPAVVSGGWGTSLDVCRALPAERLSCGGSLAAAVRPRCPSPGCQDPVRCRAGASPRPASSSRLRTGVLRRAQGGQKPPVEQKGKSSLDLDFQRLPWGCAEKTIELDCLEEVKVPIERGSGPDPRTLRAETDATPRGGRPGALEWVRPEIGACALQSAAAPAASGLALRAGSVGLGREAGSGRALRLGEAPAVVSGGWGTSLDVCRALPAERLSCGGSLAAAVRPRCPSPGCQDPVRALNVKVKKFNEARVNGGSNYDSLKAEGRGRECTLLETDGQTPESECRRLPAVRARGLAGVGGLPVRPEDSAVALKGRPLVPYERIHRGHAPRRSRRACAPSGPRCSVEPAGARRTSSALVTGADCSQCVTDHGSALGCGCATDCGRPGSAVKAGFVAGRGGIRPRLGAGGAPPARLARCVGEVERERQGALEWVRPEIGACALQSAVAPAASGWGAKRGLGARCGWARLPPSSRAAGGRVWTCAGPFLRSASAAAVRWLRPCGPGAPPRGARTPCGVGLAHRLGRRLAAGLELAEGRGRECTLLETDGQTPESECRRLPAVRARGLAGVGGLPVRPEDSAVALKGRPLVPYERIHRGHAPRRSRRACAPSGPRCSVEPAGARRTSSALVTGADCSQCVTDHGSALGCGCATDCGRPGSAVKAGFVAGRGGIRPHLGAGGAPPARLARCVGEVERERQGALEWVRPEIGACALQSAAAPAASGLALRAGSVGLGREAGSGRALRLGEAPAVVSGGWGTSLDVCRALPAERLSCGGSLAAAVRPRCPSPGCQDPVRALNVKVKKFNEARVNGGSNYDSLKAEGRGRECTLLETDGQTPESECRRLPAVRARGLAGVGGLPVRPEDSAVALKGRPLVPYERIHRGHAPRRSRRACAPSGPRCSVEPAGARRTSSALVTGADCSQCVTDHGSALGCGCATDCGRPGSAVKAGFVAGRGGIRPRLGAGGAPPARLARCVGEVERERQGALEWVRPEIGACALQSAAAPAASGLALRAGSVGLGREAGSGRALRLGEAPAVVSGGWGTSLDVCRALPAERLSCGGSLAAAVRPRCPSPGCQDPVRALNVKVKKFNEARVNGGSNYDSLKAEGRGRECTLLETDGQTPESECRRLPAVRARGLAGVGGLPVRPEDSAVALKGRPLVPYERIHRGHAPRRSRRACAPSGPRCSVEPAGARRTSSALVTGADCSQCVTDHGSALGCGCATDCGRPGSAVKAGFVAGRGGIRPRLGAGGAPPARLARCVGEVERERQGALEWVRPEIGACALQSAAAPAASGLALRAGSVGLGREAGSGRALRLGEAPAVVSGGWGTSLDVCRALPAERLSCGGSLAAAVRPRCPSPGCQDPVRCRAGASPRPASSSWLRTVRPEDSAVALKGRPLVPYERIHRGHAPRRSRRACAPSGPRCSVEPAGARRTSSALVTGADCSQCVTDHGSALGCGCATDCGRPGSAVKAGFVAGRGGIRPRLGAGGAPPARLARCVGEVERERQGALEWVRPEIGACALQSAAAPAASGLALRAGSVGLGREAGSGCALRLGEAPAVVSGGWGTSLDVCRALPAERLSCGGSLAAAVRPRCPSPGCQDPVRSRAGASPRPASSSRLRTVRPEDSAVALKGRPLVPYERIHRGHAPRRSRRACAPSGPRCSVEPAGARRTSSALVTGADCSQCVTDHGSALGCGCATDCGRPGSAVKAGFVAGRGGIRPRLGAGGAPPARLARCVGEVERERQGALEWVRPEIGACALQSAAAPAASGLALRAGSVGLGREAGSGRALRLGEAPAVVSGGWGTSLDVCRALPAERLSCGGSLAAAVRPRCPSPGCQDPVRCRAGASPRPASSSRLRTGADQGNPTV